MAQRDTVSMQYSHLEPFALKLSLTKNFHNMNKKIWLTLALMEATFISNWYTLTPDFFIMCANSSFEQLIDKFKNTWYAGFVKQPSTDGKVNLTLNSSGGSLYHAKTGNQQCQHLHTQ